ncbi:MAG: Gfo/Idh/MocA family oxidoreductase [Gemmatimonadota bacterium]
MASALTKASDPREAADRGAGRFTRPRLGFVGVGWIGRLRMEAVAASGIAKISAIADTSAGIRRAAGEAVPEAEQMDSFEALLELPLDGVVIATPSGLHAEQSMAALDRGLAVFCQKPLGRTAAEVATVVESARRADRLLGVDLSYRAAAAFDQVRRLVQSGRIGDIYTADLVFHNAYGPDKAWFYDPAKAGGGCVMDLGIHLVDMALWTLGFPEVEAVGSRLYAAGRPLAGSHQVEDYATARLDIVGGASVRLACSWNLHAGQDAEIAATFYGTEGAASVRNMDGSFYDFVAERFDGTSRERLVSPPDPWGGRAAVGWAERLAAGEGFDPAVRQLVTVAEVLDRIYGR